MATTAAPVAAGRRPRSQRSGETRAAYAFLSPWILGFLAFTAGPMVVSLLLSFTSYDIINAPTYIGIENYEQLLSDPKIRTALSNTIIYTVVHVPLAMAIALGLAMLLNRIGRLSGLFRTIFYLPSMTPAVAVGVLFLLLLNGNNVLVNKALGVIGIQGPAWTTDPAWIKPGLVIMSLWSVGGTMVIFLAALKEVPQDLYEAARLDGAGPVRQFRSVTLPMISGALFFTTIVNTIASLQLFTEVYTMFFGTTSEANTNEAALFYVVYLFQQAFQFLSMGYASAMAWLLFCIIMIITAIQIKVGNRFVYYEGGD